MGPPADKEYAVDPVGVETIRPSDSLRLSVQIKVFDYLETYHCLCQVLTIHKNIYGVKMGTGATV